MSHPFEEQTSIYSKLTKFFNKLIKFDDPDNQVSFVYLDKTQTPIFGDEIAFFWVLLLFIKHSNLITENMS